MPKTVAVAGLVLLALLLAATGSLWLYLESESFDEQLRKWIIRELEDRFEVRVELARADFRVRGTRVELVSLKIFNDAYPAAEPALDIDSLLLDFSIRHFLLPSISLDRLEMDYPRFRLLEDPNGRLNLANMFWAGAARPPPVHFSPGRLEIRQFAVRRGLILYDRHPFLVNSSEGSLSADLTYRPAEQRYTGRADFSQLNLRVSGLALTNTAASLVFELRDNALRFEAVELSGDQIQGTASGSVRDLKAASYDFQTDLTFHPNRMVEPDLGSSFQQGAVRLRGRFSGDKGTFLYQGTARSPELRFRHLRFREVDAALRVDPTGTQVDGFSGVFYGGRVQASGRLYWNPEERSSFQLRILQFRTSPLLSDLGQSQVRVRGSADFKGALEWPGLQWDRMDGRGELVYRGAFSRRETEPQSGAGTAPFQGAVSLSLQSGTIRLAGGALSLPRGELAYQGWLTFAGRYRFQIELEAKQTRDLLDLAAHLGTEIEWPGPEVLEIRGPTRITGIVQGTAGSLEGTGVLQTRDIFFRNQFLGDLTSTVNLRDALLEMNELQLRGPDFQLTTSLQFSLAGGGITLLQARDVTLNRIPVEGLLAVTESSLPLGGTVSGQLAIEATGSGVYRSRGLLKVEGAEAFGQRLDRLETRFVMDGQQLSVEDLQAFLGAGRVFGALELNLAQRQGSLRLRGTRFPLQEIHHLQQQIPLSGAVDFEISAAGNAGQPSLDLKLEGPQVQVFDQRMENLRLQIQSRGEKADFRLTHLFGGNAFDWEGNVGVREPYPIEAEISFDRLPLTSYVPLLPLESPPDIEGHISGKVRLSGPLGQPEQLQVAADFSQFKLSLAGYPLQNAGPLRVNYRHPALTLTQVTLRGAETEVRVEGRITFSEAPAVNLKLAGNVNLVAMNSLLKGGTTAGQLQLETTIVGPLGDPRLVGTAELVQGFVMHPALPVTLFDAQGAFRFTTNQVSLDSFTARTIYGPVQAEGGVFLQGLQPARWQINVFASDLHAEYPADVVSALDVDLDFLRSEVSELISGAIYVRSADYTREISLSQLIFSYVRGETAPAQETTPDIALDVTIEAYRSLRIANNLANTVGSADLTVRGTLQNPVILGSLTIDEGMLFLENNKYEISRGTVNFSNPRRTRPILNFEAQTEIRDFVVSMLVNGPLDQLKMAFRSDPPLPTPSIVSLLAVGQTQEEIFGSGGSSTDQFGSLAVYGAGAVLSKSIGERLEARTSRLFGFERFSIDPFLFGNERDPGARVTLGKQLTEELSVTYSRDLGNAQQSQVVVFEYQITDWLTAVGTREQDGSVAVDFKLKKRF